MIYGKLGLVELKVQNFIKESIRDLGKYGKFLRVAGATLTMKESWFEELHASRTATKHLVKLLTSVEHRHKRRTVGKRARQTGRESIETVKRRPGRPRLPQSLKRKSNKIEKKSKLRLQRKHFIIEAGFPPIPSPRHDNASSVNLCNGRANQHSRQKKCDENSFENNQVTSMYCGHSDITTDFEAAQMLLSLNTGIFQIPLQIYSDTHSEIFVTEAKLYTVSKVNGSYVCIVF